MTGDPFFHLGRPGSGSPEAVRQGCLCVIEHTRGSPFEPDTRDGIRLRLDPQCAFHGLPGAGNRVPRR